MTASMAAALYARRDTGKGQQIDLALYDTALVSLGNLGSYYLIGGDQPKRAGNGHFASAPNSSFDTKNGKIYMAVANQKLFTDTAKALGHPGGSSDPRFATLANRVAIKPELDAADGRGAEDRHQELGAACHLPPPGRSAP
jgi:crotonobetainyl-CoA:carnitine CoA-transferase CaiB-like acyl-CoA transferase